MSEAAERWLRHVEDRGRSPATVRGYRKVVRNSILPEFGERTLSSITAGDIEDFETALLREGGVKGRGLSPASVMRVHAALRSIMKHAKRRNWIDTNPVDDVEPPTQSRRNPEAPTVEAIRRFLSVADVEAPWLGTLAKLAVATGARRGELLGLRWGDLVLGDLGGEVRIRSSLDQTRVVKDTKTHQERTVPLPAGVVASLRSHSGAVMEQHRRDTGDRLSSPQADWFVFSSPAGPDIPRNPDAVSRLVGGLVKRNDVGRFWLHGLRHFAASAMIRGNIDPVTAASVLGHSSPKLTLDTYASPMSGAQTEAVNAIWDSVS